MDELEDIPATASIQHIVPSVPQKSRQSLQRPDPSNPPITQTAKTGKIQELVQPPRAKTE